MGSYYREHVSFPNITSGPAPYPTTSLAPAIPIPAEDVLPEHPPVVPARRCSVKGCRASLSQDYEYKMCEVCRDRHRGYATTKRRKRKTEKALLTGQTDQVVWVPDGATATESIQSLVIAHDQQPDTDSAPAFEPSPPPDPELQYSEFSQQFSLPPTWDPSAIDPRLFSQPSSSELAGALTLPSTDIRPAEILRQAAERQAPPPLQPEIHPVLADVFKAAPNLQLSTRLTSTSTSTSTPAVPTGAEGDGGPLPPRFCSIKGCKTLIAGKSFFKMCEPCRDRYRSYGTTKRNKWRKEKVAAEAELRRMRADENAQRAAQGLPPLAHEETEWRDYSADAGPSTAAVASGPRMCTVSHCREILPSEYEFLRCERHRVQNRHHSKLKRVRDKEEKSAYEHWAAAVSARQQQSDEDAGAFPASDFVDGDGNDLFVEDVGVDRDEQEEEGEEEDTPLGAPAEGVPPAARGTRRTNHVCSIKACCNLLSPTNPWKMCDSCRSKDRAGRRMKAFRDSGLLPAEVVPQITVSTAKKKPKDQKDKDKEIGEDAQKNSRQQSGSVVDQSTAEPDPEDTSGDEFTPVEQSAQVRTTRDLALDPDHATEIATPIQFQVSAAPSIAAVPENPHYAVVFMEPMVPDASHSPQWRQPSRALQPHQDIHGETSLERVDSDSGAQGLAPSLSHVPPPDAKRTKQPVREKAKAQARTKGKGKGKAQNAPSTASPHDSDVSNVVSGGAEPSSGGVVSPPAATMVEPWMALDLEHRQPPQPTTLYPPATDLPSHDAASQYPASSSTPVPFPTHYTPSVPYPLPHHYSFTGDPPPGSPSTFQHYMPPFMAYPGPGGFAYPYAYAPGSSPPNPNSPPHTVYGVYPPYVYHHPFPSHPYPAPPPYEAPPQQVDSHSALEANTQDSPSTDTPEGVSPPNHPAPSSPKPASYTFVGPETGVPAPPVPAAGSGTFTTFSAATGRERRYVMHHSGKRKRDFFASEGGAGIMPPSSPPPLAKRPERAYPTPTATPNAGPTQDSDEEPEPESLPERPKVVCRNKACSRKLQSGAADGALCERCKAKVKRKEATVKHRFHLEPKPAPRATGGSA